MRPMGQQTSGIDIDEFEAPNPTVARSPNGDTNFDLVAKNPVEAKGEAQVARSAPYPAPAPVACQMSQDTPQTSCGKANAVSKGSTFISLEDDDMDENEDGVGGPAEGLQMDSVSAPFMECVFEGRDLEKRHLAMLERATEALRNHSPHFASAVVSKLTVYGQRHIVVVDHCVKPNTVRELFHCLCGDHFKRTEFARPDTREFKHHITEYKPESLRSSDLSKTLGELAKLCFPRPVGDPLEAYRMYTNAVHFGDVAFVHRDASDHDNVTVLVYPNPTWRPEFGGETMFYDEDGEIICCIEPREGRVVLFHGSILHKGSPPGRLYHDSRYTTAFKFAPMEDQGQGRPARPMGSQMGMGGPGPTFLPKPTGGSDPDPQ